MSAHTHAGLVAAIQRGRYQAWVRNQSHKVDHLDTLAAILEIHGATTEREWTADREWQSFTVCSECLTGQGVGEPWPCRTVLPVADALTRMGAL